MVTPARWSAADERGRVEVGDTGLAHDRDRGGARRAACPPRRAHRRRRRRRRARRARPSPVPRLVLLARPRRRPRRRVRPSVSTCTSAAASYAGSRSAREPLQGGAGRRRPREQRDGRRRCRRVRRGPRATRASHTTRPQARRRAAVLGVEHRAATARDHERVGRRARVGDRVALEHAELLLAVVLRRSRRHAIRVLASTSWSVSRNGRPRRSAQRSPDRGLARAHQPDEHEVPRRHGRRYRSDATYAAWLRTSSSSESPPNLRVASLREHERGHRLGDHARRRAPR